MSTGGLDGLSIFVRDGEIYDLAGRQTIVIGGAYSVGKPIRLKRGMPWFPSEQPDDETKKRVLETLIRRLLTTRRSIGYRR